MRLYCRRAILVLRLALQRVALLVANVQPLYESAEAVAAMAPNFLNVSALLALCVCFFGWLAALPLDDHAQGTAEGARVVLDLASFFVQARGLEPELTSLGALIKGL